jgi:ribosomal-protein-alanine N-acetyltransferase
MHYSEEIILSTHVKRLLGINDTQSIERMCGNSPWTFWHFTLTELPSILRSKPGLGLFQSHMGSLSAFLLTSSLVPPVAWLGGFGVNWHEHAHAMKFLDELLPDWIRELQARNVTSIYYSGQDASSDWLHNPLIERGFVYKLRLYSYDRIFSNNLASPSQGNQQVIVRPFIEKKDLDSILNVDNASFEPLWRHSAYEILEAEHEYPFFVIAELPNHMIVGYVYSIIEANFGYLVRIAVHPQFQNQGIGIRLMAETMDYFAHNNVERVLLNTEATNIHAQRLYEWFGFERVEPGGVILEYNI